MYADLSRAEPNLNELWGQINDAWCLIPQDHICILYDSMPRRIAAYIIVQGGATSY